MRTLWSIEKDVNMRSCRIRKKVYSICCERLSVDFVIIDLGIRTVYTDLRHKTSKPFKE